jgi:hypothetical protein
MSNYKIKLKNVRLSFPSLFNKAEFNGDVGKFEATFLINKETQASTVSDINEKIKAIIKENKIKVASDKRCVKDGDDVDYAGYNGHISLKAANNKRPLVIDRDKSILVEEDNKPYSGCYVNATVELWVQNNNYGKRVNCNLLAVQFAKDGESFGAGGASGSADDFDELEDDEMLG